MAAMFRIASWMLRPEADRVCCCNWPVWADHRVAGHDLAGLLRRRVDAARAAVTPTIWRAETMPMIWGLVGQQLMQVAGLGPADADHSAASAGPCSGPAETGSP
jgi:hypothetical protein